jgi:nucleoside-diphosphate-sugar epimerase
MELFGMSLEPVYEPEARQLVTRRVGSADKARSLLRFETRIPLTEGLADVIRWWRTSRREIAKA